MKTIYYTVNTTIQYTTTRFILIVQLHGSDIEKTYLIIVWIFRSEDIYYILFIIF